MADARLQLALFGIDLMTNLWAQHPRKYFFSDCGNLSPITVHRYCVQSILHIHDPSDHRITFSIIEEHRQTTGSDPLSVLTAIFPGFIGAKDDGGGEW